MAESARHGLPFIASAQAQKHVTHNTALAKLDAMVQLSVLSATLTAPPGSPADGDAYVVAASATGAWAGQDGAVAVWDATSWAFYAPGNGWLAFDQDQDRVIYYTGSDWVPLPVGPDFTGKTLLADRLGIGGATPDATNTLAFLGTNILLNSLASIDATFNKAAPGDDASFTYKTGFSARALVGLLGNDDYTIKVSSDGVVYVEALKIHHDTGAVELPQNPKFSGFCNYDQYNAAGAWFRLDVNNARHNDQGALSGGIFTAPADGYFTFGAGIRHKTNGTTPTDISLGLSVNGAAPLPDHTARVGGVIDDDTSLAVTGLLKLSAGDTVEAQVFFGTNDAFVDADSNYFWGHGVP